MNTRTVRTAGLSGILLASLVMAAQPPAEKPPVKAAPQAASKAVGDPYPLATCPISGKKLGTMGDPVVKNYDGREVRFCCSGCPSKFEKEREKSIAALDVAMVKDQTPYYPIDTSVVSGKKLGLKPVDFVYNNRLVRLADESEKGEFLKDPSKNFAALDKAVIAAQGKDYPLQNCPASNETLGSMGEGKDMVIANRLIRLCCNDCKADITKEPAKFIAMVDDARKSKGPKADPKETPKK